MASIDIFSIQPHQVSRDLRGYSVFLYGGWKTGKTTIAAKFPKAMLVAFEKGYAAIPGVMALPIESWSDFKRVLRQLKEPKAKEMFFSRIPYALPFSRLPAPSSFPTMMPAALPTPLQTQQIRSRTTAATAFAAAASVPIWPMIAV